MSGEKFDEFYVFHLCEKSKYIPLEHIPAEEVEKLLECERKGEIYKPRTLVVPSELLAAAEQAERAVKVAEAASCAVDSFALRGCHVSDKHRLVGGFKALYALRLHCRDKLGRARSDTLQGNARQRRRRRLQVAKNGSKSR